MNHRIVISGYYGFGNVGDEAALDGILAGLREVDVEAHITVLSGKPEATCLDHPGVEAMHRYRGMLAAIRSSDLLISGGGSLLQDATSALSPHYYLSTLLLARLLGKNTMIYAQGVGPLIRLITRRAVACTLNRVNAITVRDEDSRTLLEQIGVTRTPTLVCADPSFLVEPDTEAADRTLAEHELEPSRFIAVALRPWPGAEEHVRQAADGISRAASDLGVKIALIPMQEAQDMPTCEMIDGGVMLSGIGGVRVVKGVIARAGLVVGMRLHSLIFAASEGVPFVPVVYDPKVASFAQSCGAPAELSVESLTAQSVAATITAAWSARDAAAATLAGRRAAMRESALAPAHLVKALLSGDCQG